MDHSYLLKEKRFYPLFWTQFFGAFNDNFFKNALVILITYKVSEIMGLSGKQLVTVAAGIIILPFFLFSAISGQLADKLEKSRMIRWVKTAEIFIMLLALLGFYFNQVIFLIITLFFMGTQSSFFGPLKYSILPQHLDEGELLGGNGLVGGGTFLAILLGTIFGGIVVPIEPQGPVYVGIGLVIFALLGWGASLKIPSAPAADPNLKVKWNIFTEILRILRIARENRTVFLSILGISWFWVFGFCFLTLMPAYCKGLFRRQRTGQYAFSGGLFHWHRPGHDPLR